jgi:hypothetical protein
MPGGVLSHAVYSILSVWLFKHIVRIRLLIAALQDGTVRTRRSPAPGLTRQRAQAAADAPAFVAPRRFGWLLTMFHDRGLGYLMPHGPLEHLLAEPEMLALLAASPRLVRTMNPLCRALGVRLPRFPKPLPPAPPVAGPAAGAAPAVAGRVAAGAWTADAAATGVGLAGSAVARFAGGDARFRK